MVVTDWHSARDRMLLDPAVVHLNAGSAGPLARAVFERITDLRARLAAGPMDFLLREVPPLMWRAREHLAGFVGAAPNRLLFTANVTTGANLVASSLQPAGPGEILLTDHEYTPMRWCWERAARRLGMTLRTVRLPRLPEDSGEIVEAVAAAMSPRTRLFFFSHVVSSTGLVLPAGQLCELARSRGISTVVDGAHAPAFLDLKLSDIPCDFYVGSGHKWLLAPTGVGFLHVGAGREESLEPLQVSWGYLPPDDGGPLDERDRFGSTSRLRRLECEGTRDICPWLTVPETIGFQAAFGHGAIRSRMRELADHARRRLTARLPLTAVTPEAAALSGGMLAFSLPAAVDATELRRELWEKFRIEIATAQQQGHGLLRVSTHFYNTEDEIDALADALAGLLRTR